MHYPTVILTKAEQQEDAHDRALLFANELVLKGDYDYFNANGERWENSGQTYQLTSELGREAVALAMLANRRTFDAAIRAARRMLQEFTDDQIYEEDFGFGVSTEATTEVDEEADIEGSTEAELPYLPSRWQFGQVYDATSLIYGDDEVWGGEAIRNDTDYKAATEDQDNLWVTCLDFHG